MKKNAVIITGNLVQDHEFIYPYYRLLEENFNIDVCINEGKAVKGILGTDIPPNKEQTIKKIEEINTYRTEIETKKLNGNWTYEETMHVFESLSQL